MTRKLASSPPAWLVAALPLGVALAATTIVHYPALDTFFAQDDVSFIARAKGIIPTPWSLARPLSEGWVWRALVAMFGLNPLPYHLFNFALHLVNVALVFAIGVRLLGSRAAAAAAAALFGTSGIAFTPLHWISCLVELLVTTFSLAAFLVFLRGREAAGAGRHAAPLLWSSAALVIAALLSKENAILLPIAFAVAHGRLEAPRVANGTAARPRRRFGVLVPPFAAAGAYAIAFWITLQSVHYIGSEAYARRFDPAHLFENLLTYLRWLVTPNDAVRDAVATVDPSAWPVGFGVLALACLALWVQRRAAHHPAEVGATWFIVLLAPVIPLASHTYLYYMYLPLAGACWSVVAVGQQLLAARPLARSRVAVRVAIALIVALTIVDFAGVRTREVATVGAFATDRAQRESRLLSTALADLRSAGVVAGDTIAFMNPGPRKRVRLGAADPDAAPLHSYLPLEGALRGGLTIDVFFPGTGYLGFHHTIPPEWERAKIFVFFDDGHVEPIGIGAVALARLGTELLAQERWAEAESLFVRSAELNDTLADAAYGLVATEYFQGRRQSAMTRAARFLGRWPDDERAPRLAVQLREESLLVARGK